MWAAVDANDARPKGWVTRDARRCSLAHFLERKFRRHWKPSAARDFAGDAMKMTRGWILESRFESPCVPDELCRLRPNAAASSLDFSVVDPVTIPELSTMASARVAPCNETLNGALSCISNAADTTVSRDISLLLAVGVDSISLASSMHV